MALAEQVELMKRSLGTLWSNQQNLAKSEERLDEQFCVATRLSIKHLNKLLPQPNNIRENDVEGLFKDWAKFRARPDFKDLMMEWFMGVDMDALPPVKKEEPAPTPVEPVVDAGPQASASL